MPDSSSREPLGAASTRRPRAPLLLVLPAAVALAFLVLPLVALVWRAPWSTLPEQLTNRQVLDALRLSLVAGVGATALSLAFGVPLAWLLARTRFPGQRLVRALVTVPLVLLGRTGLLGAQLDACCGLTIPFTTGAVVIAEAFVAMPFLVISVEGSLQAADRRYEVAAATLGASRLTVFRRVTLPMVAPGVVAGAVLCFARALGEFGATITFAGNFPGVTTTMPLLVYLRLQTDPETAIVLSLVLLVVSLLVLSSLRDRWMRGGVS